MIMLAAENITAGYGRTMVLHDVNLEVRPGEFLGLLGPNGCGKTTLLRAVSGVLGLRSGRVLLGGRDLRAISRHELARTMSCLSQDVRLDLSYSVREVAMMGRNPHLGRLSGPSRRDRRIVERAMRLADVSHLADRSVTHISGGERQRALVAMCLAQQPQVLLLDEPTNHLDIAHQLALLDLIARLNCRQGLTVAGVFHDLNLAAEYCDRLVLLDGGRVSAAGPVAEVLTSQQILRTYGAAVHVQPNPISGRPQVIVAAGASRSVPLGRLTRPSRPNPPHTQEPHP